MSGGAVHVAVRSSAGRALYDGRRRELTTHSIANITRSLLVNRRELARFRRLLTGWSLVRIRPGEPSKSNGYPKAQLFIEARWRARATKGLHPQLHAAGLIWRRVAAQVRGVA
jgi:hypothetical protein